MDENSKRRLKRKLKGLSEEDKANKIKEIALEEELAYWRELCLKAYWQLKEKVE